MSNDFLPRAHTCSHVYHALNEGACFFVCLLSVLLAALFALQTLYSICFNMLNIHPNEIVTMCACSRDIIKINRTTVTLILLTLIIYLCYGKCNKIGNYAYFLAFMYNF